MLIAAICIAAVLIGYIALSLHAAKVLEREEGARAEAYRKIYERH